MLSCLHLGQKSGEFRKTVSGKSRARVLAPQNRQKIQRSLSMAHHLSVWRSVVGTVKKSHVGVKLGKALGLALGLAVTYAQQCDNG